MSLSPDRPRLPPRQQLVGPDRWPVVGEKDPAKSAIPWGLSVVGLEGAQLGHWTLDQLLDRPVVSRKLDLHCVTRWSKYDVNFVGLPLLSLLDEVSIAPEVRYLSFVARSSRRHSTSLSWDDVRKLEPFIALGLETELLSIEHGGPIRLIVPDRYFYKSLKWLETIEFLREDRLGYWEAEAGYHNHADPWKEERFIAASITKREAAELLSQRDFRDRDLRGLQAVGRDLTGLRGQGCRLRDADLDRAVLVRADLSDANLSGAKLRGADLRFAVFRNADLEGCDFAGADLRGADLTGASFFGASFVDSDGPQDRDLRIGPQFPFKPQQIEMLSERDRHYLQQRPLEDVESPRS